MSLIFAVVVVVVVWLLFRQQNLVERQIDLLRRVAACEAEIERLVKALIAASPGSAAEPAASPAVDAALAPTDGDQAEQRDLGAGEPRPAAPAASSRVTLGLEQRLTSHWLVWLGAVTIALGSAFLIKHSLENGWFGPTLRVLAGLAFGGLLIALGEWLRRRAPEAEAGRDYVPAALTGAGLFAAFASVYGAYALYGLLPVTLAFLTLSAFAFFGMALAMLHGPLIAHLALLGGLLTPLLVGDAAPSSLPLVLYLLSLAASALGVVRLQGWIWLAYAALVGTSLWAAALILDLWLQQEGATALGFYLLALFALVVLLLTGGLEGGTAAAWQRRIGLQTARDVAIWQSGSAIFLLAVAFCRASGYDPVSLVTLVLLAAGALVAGRWRQGVDLLPWSALLAVVAAVALWHQPVVLDWPVPLYWIENQAFGGLPGPLLPPALVPFLLITAAFAALFGLGGFAALWGSDRPGRWAALSAAAPLILLGVAYARIEGFNLDLRWASAALVLALANLAAASALERYRDLPGARLALAFYAAGTAAALGLASAMVLEEAWLTVALAAQLPVLALIDERLELRAMRPVALVVALLVLARLVFNPYVLSYADDAWLRLGWVIYGYGLPMMAFFFAGRRFRKAQSDLLITLLDVGALVFGVLLISWSIRLLATGRLDSPAYGLFEQSLHSVAWLGVALALISLERRHDEIGKEPLFLRPVLRVVWRSLLTLATFQLVLGHLLFANPLVTGEAVGNWLVLDLLLIAYGAPAILMFLIARRWPENLFPRWRFACWLLGTFLMFAYVTLEVRHAFQGQDLAHGEMSDAEWYSYSIVWLLVALAILAIGLWRNDPRLRRASLALVLLTVAKVFLMDMAALAGLYRVASFIGLGLSLVGIGYVYQRLVLTGSKPDEAASLN